MKVATKARGNTLLLTLLMVGTLALVGANAFVAVSTRTGINYQAASWQEALLAAEGSADIAMGSFRYALNSPSSWTDPANALTDSGGAWSGWSAMDATTKSRTRSTVFRPASAGTTALTGSVTIDAPSNLVAAKGLCYRIRATGTAGLSGVQRTGMDRRDNALRKPSFFWDRFQPGVQPSKSQVSRSIEVITVPIGGDWDRAITSGVTVAMGAKFVVDSYDSSNAAKSTNGMYDVAKRQSNADVAANADGSKVNIGGASVYGDVATNGGIAKATENVTGTVTNSFYQQLSSTPLPNWSTIQANPVAIVNTSITLEADKGTPVRYKLTGIDIGSANTIRITGRDPAKQNYAEIWVTKDVKLSGTSQIIIDPNVNVKFYIEGKWEMAGGSVTNTSGRAANLTLYGINPAGTTSPQWQYGSTSDFVGCIYGTAVQLKVTGDSNFFGAVVVNTVDFGGGLGAGFHFDEALWNGGTSNRYQVVSWVEDVR